MNRLTACAYCGTPLTRWQRIWHDTPFVSYARSCSGVLNALAVAAWTKAVQR